MTRTAPRDVSTRTDVLVVGAGPAGTAAAITAADRGLDVLVVDKAAFPRDKTCGDGLTAGALRTLARLGLDVARLPAYAPVDDVVLVSPSGRRAELRLPRDRAGVVPRADLDAALVDLARARGAKVDEGRAVVAIEEAADHVTAVLADGDTIRAGHLVAADGHYSTVRRLLEPHGTPALGEWSAFRQYWSGVDDARLWVLFERDLLPGYAWVFPLPGGRANVGFCVPRGARSGHAMKELWPDLLARPALRGVLGPAAAPEGRHRAWPIPATLDLATIARSRVLFVGDAAGVVDPLTGEGIAQALQTGALAADAIAGRGDAAPAYRDAVRRELATDLRFARALQRVLAHPWGARGAIRAVDANPWTRRNFARWMFEDYPRAILLTPARWRTGLISPAGAGRGR
jgi:geranylgeranyl reductase family protein